MAELAFRPHTWDADIWRSVAGGDEYPLPERFDAADVILDVGAHVGAFSYLVLDRGAGRVVAVEADPENFHLLRHNLHAACGATDRAVLVAAAAWRSDGPGTTVYLEPITPNTGGGNTLGSGGVPVAGVPFDALVRLAAALSASGRVRLAKLDCEGSEFPALYAAGSLGLVDELVGEYHEMPDPPEAARVPGAPPCTAEGLAGFLRGRGFAVEHRPTARNLGCFRAWRAG